MAERRQVPDVLLDRFLADDLGAEQRRRIDAERAELPELQRRIDERTADKRAFLEADAPADFARRLAGRLEMESKAAASSSPRPRRWLAWLAAPSAAAAVALVLTFTVTRMSSDEPATSLPSDESTVADAPAVEEVSPAVGAPSRPMTTPEVVPATPRERPADARAKRPKKPRKRKRAGGKKSASVREVLGTTASPPAPTVTPDPEPPADKAVELAEPMAGAAEDAAPPPPPPPAAPSAAAVTETRAAATTARGGLSERQLKEAQAKNVAALGPCLRASDEVAAGRYTLELGWQIATDGRVSKPTWKAPASLRASALARCVLRKMRAWRFPGAERPTTVTARSVAVTVK